MMLGMWLAKKVFQLKAMLSQTSFLSLTCPDKMISLKWRNKWNLHLRLFNRKSQLKWQNHHSNKTSYRVELKWAMDIPAQATANIMTQSHQFQWTSTLKIISPLGVVEITACSKIARLHFIATTRVMIQKDGEYHTQKKDSLLRRSQTCRYTSIVRQSTSVQNIWR